MLEKALELLNDLDNELPAGRVWTPLECRIDAFCKKARALAAPVPQQPAREVPVVACQSCGKTGGKVVSERRDGIIISHWSCPHCQQPAQVQPEAVQRIDKWLSAEAAEDTANRDVLYWVRDKIRATFLEADRAAQPSDTVGWVECEDPARATKETTDGK